MSFSIDPARRSPRIRRSQTGGQAVDDNDTSASAAVSNLPIAVGRARTVPPKPPTASAAQIEAQMIGERRGLKAGAAVIDQAKVTYNRTEWSGSKDRRAPKGRVTRTDI